MKNLPRLQLFRTLWGWQGDYATAAREAAEAGFDGLEGPPPEPCLARLHPPGSRSRPVLPSSPRGRR